MSIHQDNLPLPAPILCQLRDNKTPAYSNHHNIDINPSNVRFKIIAASRPYVYRTKHISKGREEFYLADGQPNPAASLPDRYQTKNPTITPEDRIKIIGNKPATSATTKRPIEIIDSPQYEPTIRKKQRTQHPMNTILARRLEAIRDAKNKVLPVICNLSDSEDDQDPEPPAPTKSIPSPVSNDLDLSISSDSSIEEGEISEPSMCNNNNNSVSNSATVSATKNDLDNSSDSDSDTSSKASTSSETSVKSTSNEIKPVNHKQEKPCSVNFDLSANKICEYIPDNISKHAPSYVPTPIVRTAVNTGSVPGKDILFDLWQIIRKIDQGIGRDLEIPWYEEAF